MESGAEGTLRPRARFLRLARALRWLAWRARAPLAVGAWRDRPELPRAAVTDWRESEDVGARDAAAEGEMSEKLRRCRKELAAAIDKAFEEIVAPTFNSPQDYSIHLIPECQTSPSTAYPKSNQFVFGTNSTLGSSYVHQSFPICYSSENVYPAILPSHFVVNANRYSVCPKRKPLTSKENVMMNSSVPDEQPMRACVDGENWRKRLRKDADRYLNQEVFGPKRSYGQELTKDLLDIIEHTSIQTIEEVTGKLEFENVLNKVCNAPLKEDDLSLTLYDYYSNITDAEEKAKHETLKAADDNILDTVLDLEEEYDLMPSVRQLD